MDDKIELIKEQFKTVIRNSQYIENPQVDELFKRWFEAKRKFIEKMDGELIYQYPKKVCFSLEEKQKKLRVEDFICKVDERFELPDLADFIFTNKDGFFSNTVLYDYDYGGKKVTKGTKLLKAFKYFTNSKETLTYIQDLASQIIQQDKIEGYMCFSVHPLDYLSVSENVHNWRSCHALDGEHRVGNLNYMVDESTVVCYIKAEKDEFLPAFGFKWNSKKWRNLIFFSNDWAMLFAGRPYPFGCDEAVNFITSHLICEAMPTASKFEYGPWYSDKIRSFKVNNNSIRDSHIFEDPYVLVGGKLRAMTNLIKDGTNTYHFNDLILSSCYDAKYCYKMGYFNNISGITIDNYTQFEIGKSVPCLVCGQEDINYSDVMVCECCYNDYFDKIKYKNIMEDC